MSDLDSYEHYSELVLRKLWVEKAIIGLLSRNLNNILVQIRGKSLVFLCYKNEFKNQTHLFLLQ